LRRTATGTKIGIENRSLAFRWPSICLAAPSTCARLGGAAPERASGQLDICATALADQQHRRFVDPMNSLRGSRRTATAGIEPR
jgi:hypothetical protein